MARTEGVDLEVPQAKSSLGRLVTGFIRPTTGWLVGWLTVVKAHRETALLCCYSNRFCCFSVTIRSFECLKILHILKFIYEKQKCGWVNKRRENMK